MYDIVSLFNIIWPEPGYASVESTNISVSPAPTSLTTPVKYITEELNDCLASDFLFKLTNLVKIILGAEVYPLPGSITLIPVILPWSTVASALAPIPPPPVINMKGGSW